MITQETMLGWTPAAVEAWATVATAIAAGVGVPFLLWDRFAARPHGVNGYVVLAKEEQEISVYLVNDLGERMIVTSVGGGQHFSLTKADRRTPAEKLAGGRRLSIWMRTMKLRKVVPRDHAGDQALLRFRIRTPPDQGIGRRVAQKLTRARIEIRGVLPYRRRPFRVFLDLVDGSLRIALLRREQNSQSVS